ncbi:glycine betaine ABC transporter substrate-binding protein [Kocuria tytonis]|uniref:ABC transporter substrate-binding protein n=1 Tax=Kocuria tytonis TaxID=2054280 RepID=A0A495A9Z0_9MICC|nr:glycine betaine ABC transporter substrate-binding protein [Kocuria tytonis]RKQ36859.1 ABC transporter substrate-binding protein [Kocuria tytonis]
MSRAARVRVAAVLAVGALTLGGCGTGETQNGTGGTGAGAAASSPSGGDTVKIATGVDGQTRTLAHYYQQRLADDGVAASVVDVGTTREQIFDALRTGRATVVPDFTGDLYVFARHHGPAADASASPSPAATGSEDAPRGLLDSLGQLLGITGETGPSDDDVYRALPGVLPEGLEVLDSSGAQRTDRFVVTAETNAQYDLGDLDTVDKHCGKLSVGMAKGYADSAQGQRGLKAYYDCAPRSTTEYASTGELVDALLSDRVQAAVLRSSEPVIDDDGLVVLDDPNRLFRPERAVVLGTEGLGDAAVSSINGASADLRTEDLTTITRLTDGTDSAMTPEKAARFVREQPR